VLASESESMPRSPTPMHAVPRAPDVPEVSACLLFVVCIYLWLRFRTTSTLNALHVMDWNNKDKATDYMSPRLSALQLLVAVERVTSLTSPRRSAWSVGWSTEVEVARHGVRLISAKGIN